MSPKNNRPDCAVGREPGQVQTNLNPKRTPVEQQSQQQSQQVTVAPEYSHLSIWGPWSTGSVAHCDACGEQRPSEGFGFFDCTPPDRSIVETALYDFCGPCTLAMQKRTAEGERFRAILTARGLRATQRMSDMHEGAAILRRQQRTSGAA